MKSAQAATGMAFGQELYSFPMISFEGSNLFPGCAERRASLDDRFHREGPAGGMIRPAATPGQKRTRGRGEA